MMMMMMTSIQKERGTWHHTFQGLKKEFVSSWVVQHQYMYVHSESFLVAFWVLSRKIYYSRNLTVNFASRRYSKQLSFIAIEIITHSLIP